MQHLLHISECYCKNHGLVFNTSKTKSMVFGNGFRTFNPSPLLLNAQPIEYVSEWRYLGCLINNGKELSFSCKSDLTAFRRSANSIFSSLRKPNEQVSMKLLYTFSVPILTYASEVKVFSCSDMRDCNVALNNAIRRIFSYNRWESIRTLRQQLGYRDLTTTFAFRTRGFYAIPSMQNETVIALYQFLLSESL